MSVHYVRGTRDNNQGTVDEAFVAASSEADAIERFRSENYGIRYHAVSCEHLPRENQMIQFYA